ncbi:hypothetical protein C8P68_10513 [Mucilaginibacter yixingensis]|uniref:Uncharacterized protein n=1 Tax=Mucilaginibacter yixingensis TaxID=1295612 RepID=A0A2T5J7R9_9SPHI|nr:hypothetical protein [Mucilaginibacter yixingensis]PTQ95508.1 hypothetical protein C8P68_10513 [Mucilaginibacter yixingensis]
MKTKPYLILLLVLSSMTRLYAQQGQTEFESSRVYADLENTPSKQLISALRKDDASAFKQLQQIFQNDGDLTGANPSEKLGDMKAGLAQALKDVNDGKNVAVILVYRTLTDNAANFDIDFSSLNVKVFHKAHRTDTLYSNYLLATKTVYFVLVDGSNDFFANSESANVDKKLTTSTVKVNYKTSYLKQSFNDLVKVWGSMGAAPVPKLGVTMIKVNASRIKDPCDIVLSNKSFKADQTFTVHEMNYGSFQVGVTNSKLNVQDVSISGGNLTVKPSADQAKDWKSNAYAILELHPGRDIDNFRPLWKSLFSKQDGQTERDAGQWLVENIFGRMGVYGGAKISSDPLSNLYAGCNFAVTKEFGFNFGWSWVNQYANQVTSIGSITSVDDALKYAHRQYAKGAFSIGISFSPAAFSTALGLKSKSADSGN